MHDPELSYRECWPKHYGASKAVNMKDTLWEPELLNNMVDSKWSFAPCNTCVFGGLLDLKRLQTIFAYRTVLTNSHTARTGGYRPMVKCKTEPTGRKMSKVSGFCGWKPSARYCLLFEWKEMYWRSCFQDTREDGVPSPAIIKGMAQDWLFLASGCTKKYN